MEVREYSWKAADAEGRIIQGTWQGTGLAEIRRRLFFEGYYPLRIRSSNRLMELLSALQAFDFRWNSLRFWANLTQRLGMLLEAGIPIISALELMTLQERRKARPGPQTNWGEVKGFIEAGLALSEALDYIKPPPTQTIRALIRAGEQAGKLSEILNQLARDLEEEYQFRHKIQETLAYPGFLFVLALVVIFVLGIFVLPVYEQIFSNLDSSLPIMTQVIFTVARRLPFIISLILAGVLGGIAFLRLKHGKGWREKGAEFLGWTPLWGSLYKQSDQVQFFRILGTLMEAGIPLADALNLAQETVRLPAMKGKIRELIHATREGRRLSLILQSDSFFPPDVALLWAIGEESGQLSTILQHLAKMTRRDLEEKMERLTSILGPVLVMGMAAIIGAVAIGVMMPIFDVGTKIQ
ncbi:type II secretion system F family protein [Desulfitobacterium sp.]|uniref:type II secretion system F family protein n=1 Tax=Desulfitobacterium sp. TaxID=49981 RepID=UPI002BAA781A|nr:type II secretion system F family protein [Desulfitobacterium sp.]HVJ48897.1 type II secretion system F family protein [Desulfitobacterium sp.]